MNFCISSEFVVDATGLKRLNQNGSLLVDEATGKLLKSTNVYMRVLIGNWSLSSDDFGAVRVQWYVFIL